MASGQDACTRWFTKFETMKPGEIIKIEKVACGRPDLFVQMCKEFIDLNNPNYDFNNDYTKFRRLTTNF